MNGLIATSRQMALSHTKIVRFAERPICGLSTAGVGVALSSTLNIAQSVEIQCLLFAMIVHSAK